MEKIKHRLHKFDSVEQLKSAYEALEAEFTKRCQQVAEQKKQLQELKEKIKKLENTDLLEVVMQDDNIKKEIVNQYLVDMLSRKRTGVLTSKIGCSSIMPPNKPKTLKEAQKLADMLISQQG